MNYTIEESAELILLSLRNQLIDATFLSLKSTMALLGPSTEMARLPCPASLVHTLKSVGWPCTPRSRPDPPACTLEGKEIKVCINEDQIMFSINKFLPYA